MSDHRTGRSSRLPTDPGYWEGLASRIDARGAPLLAARRRKRAGGGAGVWWARPRFAMGLAASAVLAVLGAWLFLPAAQARPPRNVMVEALGPRDPLAARLLEADAPPAIESLLPAATPGRDGR